MPAWIAGIHQVRKEASGDIHVSLDSSIPCWNDQLKRSAKLTGTPRPYFQRKPYMHKNSRTAIRSEYSEAVRRKCRTRRSDLL